MLLTKEMEEIHGWAQKMLGNYDFFEAIRDEANVYEEPIVGTIMGRQFKAKADILGPERIIDLKTTGNIDDFKWSARKYGYDSQCYIYQSLFGVPLVFFAIDKKTGMMGMYEPSEDFVTTGSSDLMPHTPLKPFTSKKRYERQQRQGLRTRHELVRTS
jgi:hypothetical protein